MKKQWWAVAIGVCCLLLLAIMICVVAVLIYFGMTIDYSSLWSFDKPKDLGVRYTQADLTAGRETTGVKLEDLSADTGKSLEFSGSLEITGEYTDEMITAMISEAKYKYYPLNNTQVLIHDDGMIETSGNIDIVKLVKWASDLNGSGDADLLEIESYSGLISSNPKFYLQGTMSMTNNQIDLNIQQAQVSFFSATPEQISEYQAPLIEFVEQQIANVPNMNIKSAYFQNGELILDGTYPAVEKSAKE
jgi:hypothetical protein